MTGLVVIQGQAQQHIMKIHTGIFACGHVPRAACPGRTQGFLSGRVFLLACALCTLTALLLWCAPHVASAQPPPPEAPLAGVGSPGAGPDTATDTATNTASATGAATGAATVIDTAAATDAATGAATGAAPPAAANTGAADASTVPGVAQNPTPETAAPAAVVSTPVPTPAPVVAAPAPSSAGIDDQGKPDWRQLEPGLDFGQFRLNDNEALLTALRIDPAYFNFILCARSQDGGPLRSLNQWAEQYDLSAAINASMYLPDGSTSTGYMKQDDHFNNRRVVQRFGAFFVAGPTQPSLPGAAIVDRDDPQWEQRIAQYRLVIQNYRMTSADRRILWSPGGPHYSISAVAQDGDGRILFLHCRQPVEAYAFAQQLLHLPLNVRTVMYVEGGGQAGLLVRSAHWQHELLGISPAGFLVTGDLRALLPNVLGAVRIATPPNATDPDAPTSDATASGSAASDAAAPDAAKADTQDQPPAPTPPEARPPAETLPQSTAP